MTPLDEALSFYRLNYQVVCWYFLEPGKRIILGDQADQLCRFCGKRSPEVTFRHLAHAIPESLGNKSLFSAYECDSCNKFFGDGIENDFGNWSKPMRTLTNIKGKKGVPTLKNETAGWRVEYDSGILKVNHCESDPIFTVDMDAKHVTFQLKRDSYTPEAVLKAFVKMGLSVMPEVEIPNFAKSIEWIGKHDNEDRFVLPSPVIYSSVPSQRPNDVISILVIRRKDEIMDTPYAYFILGYGNEYFQVMLPSQERDQILNGQSFLIKPFPNTRFGSPNYHSLDLTDRQVVHGEIVSQVMTFGTRRRVDPISGQAEAE